MWKVLCLATHDTRYGVVIGKVGCWPRRHWVSAIHRLALYHGQLGRVLRADAWQRGSLHHRCELRAVDRLGRAGVKTVDDRLNRAGHGGSRR